MGNCKTTRVLRDFLVGNCGLPGGPVDFRLGRMEGSFLAAEESLGRPFTPVELLTQLRLPLRGEDLDPEGWANTGILALRVVPPERPGGQARVLAVRAGGSAVALEGRDLREVLPSSRLAAPGIAEPVVGDEGLRVSALLRGLGALSAEALSGMIENPAFFLQPDETAKTHFFSDLLLSFCRSDLGFGALARHVNGRKDLEGLPAMGMASHGKPVSTLLAASIAETLRCGGCARLDDQLGPDLSSRLRRDLALLSMPVGEAGTTLGHRLYGSGWRGFDAAVLPGVLRLRDSAGRSVAYDAALEVESGCGLPDGFDREILDLRDEDGETVLQRLAYGGGFIPFPDVWGQRVKGPNEQAVTLYEAMAAGLARLASGIERKRLALHGWPLSFRFPEERHLDASLRTMALDRERWQRLWDVHLRPSPPSAGKTRGRPLVAGFEVQALLSCMERMGTLDSVEADRAAWAMKAAAGSRNEAEPWL